MPKRRKEQRRQVVLIVLMIIFGLSALMSYAFIRARSQITAQGDYLKASLSDSEPTLSANQNQWRRFEFDQIPITLNLQDPDNVDAIPAMEKNVSFSGKRTFQTKTGILTKEELDESKAMLQEELIRRHLENAASDSEFAAQWIGKGKVDFFESDITVGTSGDSYVVGFEGELYYALVPKNQLFSYLEAQYGIAEEDILQYTVESFTIRREGRKVFGHLIFSSEPEQEQTVLTSEETE